MKKATKSILNLGAFTLLSALCVNAALAYTTAPKLDHEGQQTDQIHVVTDDEPIIIPPGPNQKEPSAYPNLVIQRDLSNLPAPVSKMREGLIKAARTGDIEALWPLIDRQAIPQVLSFDEVPDPIEYLRSSSNDGEGRELLAIMIELLDAPYSIVSPGDGGPDIYVWPGYATNDLQNLTPAELVDVYKIVSHLDLEEMQLFGGWYFYRIGIDANGTWRYFVAGD